MDLIRLLERGDQLVCETEKNEKWASKVCQWSEELHESIFEVSPPLELVAREILPILKRLHHDLLGIKAKDSCVKYVNGFIKNVSWRIDELETYPAQTREVLPSLPLEFKRRKFKFSGG